MLNTSASTSAKRKQKNDHKCNEQHNYRTKWQKSPDNFTYLASTVCMMVALVKTPTIELERPGASSSHWIMYGRPGSIAKQQNSNYTRVAYFQHSCTVLNAGKLQKETNFPYQMRETYRKNIWHNFFSNEELLRKYNQLYMATILTRKRWIWWGHVIRKYKTSNTKVALHWTLDGKRKRRRPRTTWRRIL